MGTELRDHRDQGGLVEQVAPDERDPVLDVGDPLEAHGARTPHHADDLVTLLEEQFREVGAVLARNAGDQRSSGHREPTVVDGWPGPDGQISALQCAGVPVAALVSFRLGGTDGVSIESAKWANAARAARLRRPLRGRRGGRRPPHRRPRDDGGRTRRSRPPLDRRARAGLDLVIVENLCSLPLNPAAARRHGRGVPPVGPPSCITTTSRGNGRSSPRRPFPTTPPGAT